MCLTLYILYTYSYLGLPLGTPRNALSPDYGRQGAEVAMRFSGAGCRSASFLAAPSARLVAIQPPAVRHHVFKIQPAVTPTNLRFLADSTGDPPSPSNREFVITLFISDNGLRHQKKGSS